LCKQLGVEHVLNGIHFAVFPFVLLVGGQFGNFLLYLFTALPENIC
jgi:hypothetical protein